MRSSSPPNCKKSELVSQFIHIPENLNSFEFDTCFIYESFILKNIAGYIFKKVIEQLNICIDEENLIKFINIVCDNYKPNPFHNFQHAINVLQMTYRLLVDTNIYVKIKPNIIFGILVAALCHDIDHPGNTNSYEINSFSKYAKLYNDICVLENHHCTLTFEFLEQTGLLMCFKGDDFKEFRKTIIISILGTDMTKHNEFITKLETFDCQVEILTIEDQYFIVSAILHCADLSNSVKQFDYSFEWSKRLSQEFYEQTVKEEAEGLPSLPFMKVRDSLTMCINEISFIENITLPIWNLICKKFANINILLSSCNNNLIKWKDIETKLRSINDISSYF